MEPTDVAQLRTAPSPGRLFAAAQPRAHGRRQGSGRREAREAQACQRGQAHPLWLRSLRHSGDQGSPSGGSISARPRRSSNVRAGRIIGIPRIAWGGKATPIKGGPGVGLGEPRLEERPASVHLVSLTLLAALATLGGPTGGRNTRGLRHRNGRGVARAHRSANRGHGSSSVIPSGDIGRRSKPGRRGSITRGDKQRGFAGVKRGQGLGRGRLVDRLDVPRQRPHGDRDGGRRRSINRGLSGDSLRSGSLHVSRKAAGASGAAQDGRRFSSLAPQPTNEVPTPGTRRVAECGAAGGPASASGSASGM